MAKREKSRKDISQGVFVDTSAWYALISRTDQFHGQAKSLFASLAQANTVFHASELVFSETMALLSSRFNKALGIGFGDSVFGNPCVQIHASEPAVLEDAWQRFQKTSEKISFVDCHSMSLMTRLGLVKIFTFDEDFSAAGFFAVP